MARPAKAAATRTGNMTKNEKNPLSHELLHTRYYDRKPVVEPKK